MNELQNFYNKGFGWICRACERDFEKRDKNEDKTSSRLLREGEAESRQPELSTEALAKWADKAQTTLTCPRCGITQPVNKF